MEEENNKAGNNMTEEVVDREINKYEKKNKKLILIIIRMIVLTILLVFGIIIVINSLAPNESIDKPIIYIYPKQETKVTVSVSNPENLTTTYPKYKNGWEVIAKPNGDLTDIKTRRKLYSLYWEGKRKEQTNFKEGFCIKGEETASFLEEKLSILGLNEREAQEFIIYWLPKMEHNQYNLIHFETQEEIESNMGLNISPKPDTLIRVMMAFKPSRELQEIPEQKLEQVERKGYTVVEWGGTEVK